jgi:hypothetical protein
MGGIDATIKGHGERLGEINGSIATLANKMTDQATAAAVMANSLMVIERVLDTKMLSHESRLTVMEAWIAERRGGSDVTRRGKQRSTQWWLAVFAAIISLVICIVGAVVAVTMSLIVLSANGKL